MRTQPHISLRLIGATSLQLAALALGSLLLVPSESIAQPPPHVLWRFNVGHPARGTGDFDGDGVEDISSIGPPVTVFSGATGAVLWTASLPIGGIPAGVGDLDADGFDDLAIGDPQTANPSGPGQVWVMSAATGATIHAFTGLAPGDRFGGSLDGAGDVDADGTPDIIIGAPQWGLAPVGVNNQGYAQVFSGLTGNLLHMWAVPGGNSAFGWSVAGCGDVNGDGHDDVIVGDHGADNGTNGAGKAFVYSGQTGALLHTVVGGPTLNDANGVGYSVSGAGDVNGDGLADFIVGAPFTMIVSNNSYGRTTVHSGATGGILHTFNGDGPGDDLGWSVGGGKDFDGDGIPDIVAGAPEQFLFMPYPGPGYVRVFSGASGTMLFEITGRFLGDGCGRNVDLLGDMTGDGRSEVLVNRGGIIVYASAAPTTPSLGAPPIIGTSTSLQLTDPTNASVAYVCGLSTGFDPGIDLLSNRVVPLNFDPLLILSLTSGNPYALNTIGTLNAAGSATVTLNLPPLPALIGVTVYAAFVTADPTTLGIGTISGALPIVLQ